MHHTLGMKKSVDIRLNLNNNNNDDNNNNDNNDNNNNNNKQHFLVVLFVKLGHNVIQK